MTAEGNDGAAWQGPAMSSTERVRETRRRRRQLVRLIKLEIRAEEVDALIKHRLLETGEREDSMAIRRSCPACRTGQTMRLP
jgi:hypothetical protein